MVVFSSPQWLFLIPVFLVTGWFWKGLRLWRPLRGLCLLLLVLVLADPRINRTQRGMDLWVLVDRSASAVGLTERSFKEWEQLLRQSMPSRSDRIRWVNFSGEAVEFSGPENTVVAGAAHHTRTRLAIETVMASLAPDRHARMLVFTDGFATEPLGDVGLKLQSAGVPLDFRLVVPPEATDYQILDLRLPSRKRPGEPFVVEIELRGTKDGSLPVLISRDGGEAREEMVGIKGGSGVVRFAVRLAEAGAHRYEARLPVSDAYSGNNRFEGWVEIVAGPRVLLVTRYPDDPLERILSAQGFTVEKVMDPSGLHAGQLTGAKVVILNNVPAYEIPSDFLASIDFFVRRQGGGLLMAGGTHSFGAGGYFESSIDPLLPVSMELKAEHRKLAVAMAIVMDRSGSMAATVAGGRTKMDLANEGAARAVELLGDFDFVTVHAVDSSPHREVPLTAVGTNRASIVNRVRRIGSTGGGIFVYEGLKAGWEDLKKAEVGQRHLILFSDAADSEEPGDYKRLVGEMVREGATVSVIGLGTEKDVDAALLKDIAKLGNGRMFFTDDATTVPNIFAQETVAVARSMFVKEPVGLVPSGRWLEISRDSLAWLPQVDGYNLSYARPQTSVAALTTDEYKAPLVSCVQRGLGRSAAVSFPLAGDFSGATRRWPQMGDFAQTLTRWLMGETLPPGLGLRTKLDGTELVIDLLHDDSWFQRLAVPPRVFLADGAKTGEGAVREVAWERIEPGHFRAKANLEHGVLTRGAVQVGDVAMPFGPVVVGGSPEWTFDRSRVEELRQVSAQSGGAERINLAEVWQQPEKRAFATIQPWLLIAALLLILAEALATRLGWNRISLGRRPGSASGSMPTSPAGAYRTAAGSPASPPPGGPAVGPGKSGHPEVPAAKSEETAEAEVAQRRSRFDRAKRLR
jgi:hypothetical protein